MSLLHVRRDRRKSGAHVKKPPSPLRLIALLVLVGILIWYLSQVA